MEKRENGRLTCRGFYLFDCGEKHSFIFVEVVNSTMSFIEKEEIMAVIQKKIVWIIFILTTIFMVCYLKHINAQSMEYLTGFLVIITAYYAWQTNNMVEEMKLVRQYQFIPALKIKPTSLSVGSRLDIEIKNFGFGPAKDIRGVIRIEPNGEEIKIVCPLLNPSESFSIRNPHKNDIGRFKNMTLDVTFRDIVNKKSKGYDIFIIEDVDKIPIDSYRKDKIAQELSNVSSNLKEIERAISNQKRQ